MNATGSLREQSRRENNGTKHRETMRINLECAADNPQPRIKRGKSVDTNRINQIAKSSKVRIAHDIIRMQFGPRLVKSDGTALYQCQVK
jgi:hypothetical protein